MPKPIEIQLTAEQVLQLQRHYAYVAEECEAGRTGLLLAQVGQIPGAFGPQKCPDKMQVGFIPAGPSKQIMQALADYREERRRAVGKTSGQP